MSRLLDRKAAKAELSTKDEVIHTSGDLSTKIADF